VPVSMTHETTDVVIVGGGLAGMTAADAARSEGARVLLLDRTALGLGSNTALSNGVFAGPTAAYPEAAFLADTHRIGKGLGQQWMAHRIAADICSGIEWLSEMGLEIVEKRDHYFVVARGANRFPGVELAKSMAAYIIGRSDIQVWTGTRVERVITADGKALGVIAGDNYGRRITIHAGAVVLATGGAGALFRRNDNQKSTLGQGYALALDAGLALMDMEFVQFYPIVMAQPHLPQTMLNSPHPEGSRIINVAGEDLAAKYAIADLNDAIRNRRDWLSAILFEEGKQGDVFMDYRAVAPRQWEHHPLVLLKDRRFDFLSQPVAISPAAHYVMGGVRIDGTGETAIAGLFACGEVVWGLHGACRKGGNALSECLVFGRIAGRHAAQRALENVERYMPDALPLVPDSKEEAKPAITPRELRRQLQTLAWSCAGVVRDSETLGQGLAALKGLEPQIQCMPLATPRDRRVRQDLDSMWRVLKAVLIASSERQESRGCFLRSDYPQQDDARWQKNSQVKIMGGMNDLAVSHVEAGKTSDQAR